MKQFKNKKIGIIGGVGPQATGVLYSQIISLSGSLYGANNNDDFPRVVIESVPIPDFISEPDKIPEAKDMLSDSLKNLERSGANAFAIACNTVHLLADELKKNSSIEFISMIELVVKECSKRGIKKVGLLASPMTFKIGLYDSILQEAGIELIRPRLSEYPVIENMIRNYIAGESNGKYRDEYFKILDRLFERGSEAVILGCTELPLVVDYGKYDGKIINSSEVLAKGLVDYYYNS